MTNHLAAILAQRQTYDHAVNMCVQGVEADNGLKIVNLWFLYPEIIQKVVGIKFSTKSKMIKLMLSKSLIKKRQDEILY